MCLRIPFFPSHYETARAACCLLLMILALGLFSVAQAQESPYDPSWYNPSQSYVKVAVVEDGVYQITGADLTTLGMSTSSISPRTLKVYKNGQEIPLWSI